MQCLEGLNHRCPPLCLFVQLCPSVRWELEEFRPGILFLCIVSRTMALASRSLTPSLPAQDTEGGQGRCCGPLSWGTLRWVPWYGALPGDGVLGAVDQVLWVPLATSTVGMGTTQPHPALASSLCVGTRRD